LPDVADARSLRALRPLKFDFKGRRLQRYSRIGSQAAS
jgi:hypothetical protein